MKNKLLKTLTPLVLVVLLIATLASVFVITAGAAETTATLSFATTDNRKSYSTQKQVWEQNGITFTNEKSKSTTNVANYANPIRLYAKSSVTIECSKGNITKIVFNCSESKYASPLSSHGANVNGTVATIELDGTQNSYTIQSLTRQVRFTSIEVTYTLPCQHVWELTTSTATCTEGGTGTYTCSLCQDTKTETVPATGHKDENTDSVCDVCKASLCTKHVWIDGEVKVEGNCTTDRVVAQVCQNCGQIGEDKVTTAPGHTEVIDAAVPATCTETGLNEGKHCSVCNEVLVAQTTIPATGHNFENGECTVCHEKQPTKITINRDSFGEASGYAWHGWSATATTGKTISGSGFIYGTTTGSIQMNSKQTGHHIYNTTPLPGKIVSITLTAASGTPRDFYVLTSNTPYTKESTPDTTDATLKNVTTSGATWEFTTTGRYFAIVVKGGAAYLSSIEITYEVCSHANTEEVAEVPATCTTPGTNAGVKCSDCGDVISGCEEISALGHTFGSDEKCSKCEIIRYTKVQDVTKLSDGDVIVIYYPDSNLLLSGTASETKLEGVEATVKYDKIYTDNNDLLALTVHKDENGDFYFETADGKYLTGTKSNSLTLEETLYNSAKWYFNTEGTTATLRIVNRSNDLALEYYGNLFTVYNMYDKAAYNFEIYSYAVPKITTVGASLNTGVTIRVTYNIPEAWLNANAGAKVAFTCAGETKKFDAESGSHTYYVNLASHLINKDITVQVVDSEGNALTTPQNVSLSTYRAKLDAANAKDLGMTEDKKTKALALIDAAIKHSDYASGERTEDITFTKDEFVASEVVKNFAGSITVKANLSAKIKLIIGITSDVAPTVTVDGQAVECTYVDNVLTIGGLYHTKFNDVIIISVGDTAVLTFSFNSYLKAIYDSNATDKNLAAATYLYGVAAEEYIKAE